MLNELVKNQFQRNDGYNPVTKSDEKYQEHWIHKQVVKKTGDREDDFIIEEKAVMIEKVNIFKSIQEEAKTTDLKELLRQFALSGDESILNRRTGFYGDVSQIQEHLEGSGKIVDPEVLKAQLPQELQKLSVEEIARMSDEDIVAYYAKVRSSMKEEKEVKVEEKEEEIKDE